MKSDHLPGDTSDRRRLSRVAAATVTAAVATAMFGGVLAAGAPSAGAATGAGSVTAWGHNASGQTNVPVAAQSDVKAIAAGGSVAFALKTDGSLVGWGDGYQDPQNVPAEAQTGVAAVDAEDSQAVALKTDGTVVSWGQWHTLPTGLTGVTQVAAISSGGLALKSDHTIVAWGPNSAGERDVPAAVQGHAVSINGASQSSFAVTDTGSVVAWGNDVGGQTEVPDAAKSGVVKIAAYGNDVAAVKSDGSVVTWGASSHGIGPTPAAAMSGVVDVAVGFDYAIALKANGALVAWGPNNAYGQQNIPGAAAAGVTDLAAGAQFAMTIHAPFSTPVAPSISGTPTPAVLGQPYDFALNAAGNPAPSLVQVTAGTLPAGLSMDSSGRITGTPTKAGRTTVTVTATSSLGSRSAPVTITVQPAHSTNLQFIDPPASVETGALESDQYVRGFAEQYNQVLTSNLTVGGTTIPAGTKVNVYYLHADHVGSDNVAHRLTGSELFGTTVLATATSTTDLQATTQFGAASTTYSTNPDQGLEYDDSVTKRTDQTGVDYTLNSWNASDAARIFTLAP
ncbi:MAG TPA: hypothetical protein VNP92_13655 [Actinophytocola sp.]|nr:hypothetical protein [Actinophytocola sp.]